MTAGANQNLGARPVLALMVHIVIVLGLTAGLMAGQGAQLPTDEGLSVVGTVLLFLSGWLILSWVLSDGSVLNPYGLFLAGSMPFHIGFSVLRLLGQDHLIWLRSRASDETLLQTLVFVTACYALLHLGALLSNVVSSREPAPGRPTHDGTRVYHIGWILLAISLVPLLLQLRSSFEIVMSGGYSSLFEGQGQDYHTTTHGIYSLISKFYLPGVMFLLAGSRGRPIGQLMAALGLALYSGSYLFLGFRAFSLIPIAVFVWLYHRTVRKLPVFPLVLGGGALFLIVAPLIRSFRDISGIDRMSFEVLWEAFAGADNPILALIAELGGSILTIAFTAELVPEVRPFEWGYGYLYALANAVPMLKLPDAYGYAGSWLAFHVTPSFAVGGFGLGFSFMAESYMNFGWVGGALFMAVIGAAIVWVQRWASRTNDPARFAFIASFLPVLIFYTRGESISISRPILWYALIPLLAVIVLRMIDREIAGDSRRPPTRPPHPLRRAEDRPHQLRTYDATPDSARPPGRQYPQGSTHG